MTKIIILNSKKCQIISEDTDLLKQLHKFLSFKLVGVEYSPAYQAGGWNGITYLLSKTNKFNYGLLSKVKTFLKEHGEIFEIEDKRPPIIENESLDISHNLKKHNLIPRDHQIRILEAVKKTDRGIIRAATGSGKSLTTVMATAYINKPTIIYVIGLDLLDQFHKLFSKLFDEEIGYIGDGICNIQRINIASIWSIGRSLKLDKKNIIDEDIISDEKDMSENNQEKILKMLKETDLHILDECHVAGTATIDELYKNINPTYLFGFSGTPFPDPETSLSIINILGEQIINVSASELINLGLLAQPIIKFYTVPKMSIQGNYLSVYKEYIVENEIRNNMIVSATQNLLEKGYTPLVLFKQIKHGAILAEKFEAAGFKFGLLNGNDKLEKRTIVKNQLIKGEINIILASTIFDIGLNIEELSGLVLAGSGKSKVKILQRCGRVIRLFENKKYAAIIDFYDQVKFLKKHSQIRYEVYQLEDGFKVIKSKEMK